MIPATILSFIGVNNSIPNSNSPVLVSNGGVALSLVATLKISPPKTTLAFGVFFTQSIYPLIFLMFCENVLSPICKSPIGIT